MWGSCFSLGSRRQVPASSSSAASSATHSLTHSLTHRRSTQSLLDELRRAWPPLGVAAAGAAAAFRVAGAGCLSRGRRSTQTSWTSCGARGGRWGRGCLSRGRHSTQSLLDELRRAWPPLGPRLITAPLLTPPLLTPHFSRPHLSHHLSHHHSSQLHFSHLTHHITAQLITAPWSADCLSCGRRSTQSLLDELRRAWPPLRPRLPFAWQAQCTELSRGRRTTQTLLQKPRAWPPLGPRLPFAWQAQYTEPPGRAAARVAACWGRGSLSRSRRSTQSLLDELRRAWLPLGPRLPFAWQAQYTEPPGRAAACVAAAGAAAAFAWQAPLIIHPSSRTTYHISLITSHLPFSQLTHHLSHVTHHSPLITTPHLTPHLSLSHHTLSHPNSSQLHFSNLTHHSSTAHHNSSQLHFSHFHFSSLLTGPLLITTHHHSSQLHSSSQAITASLLTPHLSHHNFSSQLITSQLITAPLLTPLLTPHLSHHNSSQLHFSHLTSHTLIHHSSTSHTSLITSQPITAPLLTPSFTHPLWHTIFYTPSFTHTTLSPTIFDTPSFTYHFVTHNLSHTTLSHTIFPPPPPLSFLPSPSPLQHFWLIIGRSWLVGLCGPFLFLFICMYIYICT